MWSLLTRIWRAGVATVPPERLLAPAPAGFRGPPAVDPDRCQGCAACVTACPAAALAVVPGVSWTLDLGRCQFCGRCAEVCPHQAIVQTQQYALATRTARGLQVQVRLLEAPNTVPVGSAPASARGAGA